MLRGFIKGVRGGCFVIANKWRYPQSAFTHNPGPMDINTYHLKSSIFVQFSSFQFSINWSSSEIWQEDVLEKYLKFIATAIIWKMQFLSYQSLFTFSLVTLLGRFIAYLKMQNKLQTKF